METKELERLRQGEKLQGRIAEQREIIERLKRFRDTDQDLWVTIQAPGVPIQNPVRKPEELQSKANASHLSEFFNRAIEINNQWLEEAEEEFKQL